MAQIKHLSSITITDSGQLYVLSPTISFTGGFADSSDHVKFGNNSLDMANNYYQWDLDSPGNPESPDGMIAFWLWVDSDALPDSSGSNLKPIMEIGSINTNRRMIGVDNLGRLKSTLKYANANSIFTWENQGAYGRITENQWNHVIFSFSGANSGFATRRAEIAINGVRTYYTNSTGFSGILGDSGTRFGSINQGAYGIGDVVFDSPTGMYMDNLYLDSDDTSFTLATEIAALYTNDSGGGNWFSTSLVKHMTFDNDSAQASVLGLDSDGKITGTTITRGGNYVTAPTVTFQDAPATLVEHNDSATQTLSTGVKVTGEIVKYSDSDGKLYLARVGADDGKYHTFVTGRDITFGNRANIYTRTVTAVEELNNLSQNEQNDDFSTQSDDFLDFTEDNPFGDPENQ